MSIPTERAQSDGLRHTSESLARSDSQTVLLLSTTDRSRQLVPTEEMAPERKSSLLGTTSALPPSVMASRFLLPRAWRQRQQTFWRRWLLVALLTLLLMFGLLLQAQLPRSPPAEIEVLEVLISQDEGHGRAADLLATLLHGAGDPVQQQLIASPGRLQWHEQQVTDWYLRVQLVLTYRAGSINLPPIPQPSTGSLRPLLYPRERARLRYAFELFSAACRLAGLSYFLLDSSLVGSLRHHGPVPWSDVSVVVGMRAADQEHVRQVLERVQGTQLVWSNPYSWSFRLRDVRPEPPDLLRVTYVDIRFYRENATHLWGVTWDDRVTFLAPWDRVLPLRDRPWEGALAPTPCDPAAVLQDQELQLSQCRLVEEDPREVVRRDGGPVACDAMRRVFPFVSRRAPLTSSSVLEELSVNGTALYSVELEAGCGR